MVTVCGWRSCFGRTARDARTGGRRGRIAAFSGQGDQPVQALGRLAAVMMRGTSCLACGGSAVSQVGESSSSAIYGTGHRLPCIMARLTGGLRVSGLVALDVDDEPLPAPATGKVIVRGGRCGPCPFSHRGASGRLRP